ncbi:MAG: hypothetical protein II212_04890, partial [Alistipes sp.]|nr:hypothetical protein [Alistipes sp.]
MIVYPRCDEFLLVLDEQTIGTVLVVNANLFSYLLSSRNLGINVMTPVFDGAHEQDITEAFKEANRIAMEKAEKEAAE